MGRQTSVALSESDEDALLAFLRLDADVRIYRQSARSPAEISLPSLPRRGPGETTYLLWNSAFPWTPEITERLSRSAPETEPAPEFYVRNRFGSPLVEYTRHPFEAQTPLMHGRVYWNTDFATYDGPEYDHDSFGRWYDRLVRWLRNNGVRVEITKNWSQYWLPGAWMLRAAQTTTNSK